MSAGQAFALLAIGALIVIVIAVIATGDGNWRDR